MTLATQICPQCGGSLELPEDQVQIHCPFCGTLVQRNLERIAPRYASLDELPVEISKRLDGLIANGQRSEAVHLIQYYLGLPETTANRRVDETIESWRFADTSQYMATPSSFAFYIGLAVTLAVLFILTVLAFVAAMISGSIIKNELLTNVTQVFALFMIFPDAFIGIFAVFILAFGFRLVLPRLILMRGQSTRATIKNAVTLLTYQEAGRPMVYSRVQLELSEAPPAPRVIYKIVELPAPAAAQLKPGVVVEVIRNGPKFHHLTVPIKVLQPAP